MAKITFPFHVLHGGRLYAPHEVLEVTDAEAKKLVGIGAKVLEMPRKTLEKALLTKPQPPASGKRPCAKRKG